MKLKPEDIFEQVNVAGLKLHFCKRCGCLVWDRKKHLEFEQEKMEFEQKVRDYMHRTRDK